MAFVGAHLHEHWCVTRPYEHAMPCAVRLLRLWSAASLFVVCRGKITAPSWCFEFGQNSGGCYLTKYEPETQRWRPGTGVASAGPPFQNLQFRAKISLFFFLPKTALEPARNGQMEGNSGYSTHAARLPSAEGPSRPPQLHNMSANRPQKAPKSPKICAHWLPTTPNQKQTISWATWLKTRFRVHLIHPQPPTFGGFHPSKLP